MLKSAGIAIRYTVVTAVLLGLVYPLGITLLAQLTMKAKADGQLIREGNRIVGSSLIGQPFTGAGYFHGRVSAAGTGYDAASSSGSNLGPTSKALADRVKDSVQSESNGGAVPVDLVTASASGLDPDISPAAALYQAPRVAQARHLGVEQVQQMVNRSITPRQLGLLGEPRVNVLLLNRALDNLQPHGSGVMP